MISAPKLISTICLLVFAISTPASSQLSLEEENHRAAIAKEQYPIPEYELVSEERFTEVCGGKENWCSAPLKKMLSSSDGFLFEIHQGESDMPYCDAEEVFPCSMIGDAGAGKLEMRITSKEDGRSARVTFPRTFWLKRVEKTPMDYPYIVIEGYTGGASCCSGYLFYLKEDLTLPPYVIEFDYASRLAISATHETYFNGRTALRAKTSLKREPAYLIEDIVQEHFATARSKASSE
jgi:hypothetical protein